jgi:hypothetical protein
VELVNMLPRQWLEPVDHEALLDRREDAATPQAPAERRETVVELQSAQDRNSLIERTILPNEQPVGDGAAFEQAAIPGEQDAVFGLADRGERLVVEVRTEAHVEAEQPQQAGQTAEVHVDHEAGIA